jgi:hypothetical protein
MRADRECSSPPRKRGREEVTRICPFIPAFAGMARSYCGRSRARIAATDGQAQQRRTSTRARAATLGLTTENPRSPAGRTQAEPVPPRHHHGIFAMMYRL